MNDQPGYQRGDRIALEHTADPIDAIARPAPRALTA